MANIAPDATASASFSTTSSYITPFGTSAGVVDEDVGTGGYYGDNGYGIYHSDDATIEQDNTVTLSYELAFSASKTVKYFEAYFFNYLFSSKTQDYALRLYSWDGTVWALVDTYNRSVTGRDIYDDIGSPSYPVLDSYVYYDSIDVTATKYKIEIDIDYLLAASGYFRAGLVEIKLYEEVNSLIDLNYNKETTNTLTGGLSIGYSNPLESNDLDTTRYIVDGITDTGVFIGANGYDGLTVYDSIVDLDGTFNLSALELSHSGQVNDFGEEHNSATIDWEMQYYTTEWLSAGTGTVTVAPEGLENHAEYDLVDRKSGNWSNVTKVRLIYSMETVTLQVWLLAFSFFITNFRAFTSDTTAIDIGLHIGSETIGAVVANESPLKIYVNGTTYSLPLVATTDSTASATRIYTDSVKALRKIS